MIAHRSIDRSNMHINSEMISHDTSKHHVLNFFLQHSKTRLSFIAKCVLRIIQKEFSREALAALFNVQRRCMRICAGDESWEKFAWIDWCHTQRFEMISIQSACVSSSMLRNTWRAELYQNTNANHNHTILTQSDGTPFVDLSILVDDLSILVIITVKW